MTDPHRPADDPDTDRGLFTRYIEYVFLFLVSAFMLRSAIHILWEVRLPLVIIGVIAAIGIIGYRLYKWRNNRRDY